MMMRLIALVAGLTVALGAAGTEAAGRSQARLSGPPAFAEELAMEIVVRLRPEAALLFESGAGTSDSAGTELDLVLRRLGLELRPQHPGVSDSELRSYFTISGVPAAQAEGTAAALREIGAVEAAYVKPAALPP